MVGIYKIVAGDRDIEVYALNESEARDIAQSHWEETFDEDIPEAFDVQASGQMPDFDDFMEKYRVLENQFANGMSSFCGTLFETYGAEADYVKETARRSPQRVWTLLETDGDHNWVANGFHTVNRLGYFVTEQNAENEEETYYVE